MKLPSYVKSKTIIGNFIPIIGNQTSQTLYPFIFLSKHAYDNLQCDNPAPRYIAHLAHEETHRRRQKQSRFVWLMKYIVSPKFRFNEEFEAHKEGMKVYKEYKMQYDIEKNAKFLSSFVYLWPVPYKYAIEEFKKAWDNI